MDITLSTQLKYYLKLQRMSVNKLSKKTGISQSYLNELVSGEKDNPGIQKLDLIVNALGTTFQDFFTSRKAQEGNEILAERIDRLTARQKELIRDIVEVLEHNGRRG